MKGQLPGVKVFKSFKVFLKDLTDSLEVHHNIVHNKHIKATQEAVKKVTR